MIILSVPLSFRDVLGNPYGISVVSWFNIFLFIIMATYLIKYLIRGRAFFDCLSLLSLLLIIIGLIPVLVSKDIVGAIKQYINITASFVLIIIGCSFRRNIIDKGLLKKDYVSAVIITAMGVITQIFFIKAFNLNVGNYQVFGGGRYAYGFLFADYSFLALYLSSGAMMLYFLNDRKLYYGKGWIICFSLMLLASVMTSARTGIAAFIVIFTFFNIPVILKFLKKGSIKAFAIIGNIILILCASYFLVDKIRGIAKFSDTGRMALNRKAFDVFMENPLWGMGFGSTDYIGIVPHNFFFQYLAQGGLVFTFSVVFLLVISLWFAHKRDKNLMIVLMCIFLGSMFIPNVFNSRFLPIVLFLLELNPWTCRRMSVKKAGLCE